MSRQQLGCPEIANYEFGIPNKNILEKTLNITNMGGNQAPRELKQVNQP